MNSIQYIYKTKITKELQHFVNTLVNAIEKDFLIFSKNHNKNKVKIKTTGMNK